MFGFRIIRQTEGWQGYEWWQIVSTVPAHQSNSGLYLGWFERRDGQEIRYAAGELVIEEAR